MLQFIARFWTLIASLCLHCLRTHSLGLHRCQRWYFINFILFWICSSRKTPGKSWRIPSKESALKTLVRRIVGEKNESRLLGHTPQILFLSFPMRIENDFLVFFFIQTGVTMWAALGAWSTSRARASRLKRTHKYRRVSASKILCV